VILETKNAKSVQNVTFNVSGGLSAGKLCVWHSDATAQFVQQASIKPKHGSFSITLEPNSIYSISTTTGQQKGAFANIPADRKFPFPYCETFDEYAAPQQWGYLPHYTADIASVFEISDRPDKIGKCLRQVIDKKAQSWAPEWMPYTIIGDEHWQDYEVSADLYLDNGGWAGVMGRVNNVGSGYGCVPKGYYLRLAVDGSCALFTTQAKDEADGKQLVTGMAPNVTGNQWHNVKLQFSGATISGFVDGVQVLSTTNNLYSRGLAGLITGGDTNNRNTALFDNLRINAVGAATPKPTVFTKNQSPIYKP
jgi:galactosylceramidase